MRQDLIRRVSISVSLGFAAAALGFAWLAGLRHAPPDSAVVSISAPATVSTKDRIAQGRSAFETRCERCHDYADAAVPLVDAGDDIDAGRAELASFLDRHGKSSAGESQLIVEFLASLPPEELELE